MYTRLCVFVNDYTLLATNARKVYRGGKIDIILLLLQIIIIHINHINSANFRINTCGGYLYYYFQGQKHTASENNN